MREGCLRILRIDMGSRCVIRGTWTFYDDDVVLTIMNVSNMASKCQYTNYLII